MAYSKEFNRRAMVEQFKLLDLAEGLASYAPKYADTAAVLKANMLKQDGVPASAGTPYAFIGVNPPSGSCSMRELYDLCVASYPYKGYTMCVEQHTDGGVRPHLHILHPVSKDTRKNHMISRLSKVFSLEKNFINVSVSRNSGCISRWQAYLRGEKKDEKIENVEKDIKERDIYNIPHIYKDDKP